MKYFFFLLLLFTSKALIGQSDWQKLQSVALGYVKQKEFDKAKTSFALALQSLHEAVGANDTLCVDIHNYLFLIAYYEGDFLQAKNQIHKARHIYALQKGKNSLPYAEYTHKLALLMREHANFDSAEVYFIESKKIREQLDGKTTLAYANSCKELANLYKQQGKYVLAKEHYVASMIAIAQVSGTESLDYAQVCNDFGTFYFEINELEKSIKYYVIAKNIYQKNKKENTNTFAIICNNLAALYHQKGQIIQAEAMYLQAKVVIENTVGNKHPLYATNCLNLANIYQENGLFEQALAQTLEAQQIIAQHFGKKHPQYAHACNSLAALYLKAEKIDQATKLYQEALETIATTLGKNHPDFASTANNLGVLHKQKHEYQAAEKLFFTAIAIYDSLFAMPTLQTVEVYNNLALNLSSQGKIEESIEYLNKSLDIVESKYSHNYVIKDAIMYNLATQYLQNNNLEKSAFYYKKAIENKMTQTQKQFAVMSQYEKMNYINAIQKFFIGFENMAIQAEQKNENYWGDVYNFSLFRKSIVFSSFEKMRKQILQSQDSVLIAEFEQWRALRANCNRLIEQNGDLNEIAALNERINYSEKIIALKSNIISEKSELNTYHWKQVQGKLAPNEVAIELIRTQKQLPTKDSLGDFEQQGVYLALIITKQTKTPVALLIENAADLEKKYINFYRKNIELKKEDKLSYKNFFQPIEQALAQLNPKGFHKIYFSPDGIFHQINLHTLYNSENKLFLVDQYDIVLLSSTRDLVDYGKEEHKLSKSLKANESCFFGYPIYNLENKNQNMLVETQDRSAQFSNVQDAIGTHTLWPLLEGTKVEVQNISQTFHKNKFKQHVFMAENATEEQLKAIKKPVILHIATHGFFVQPDNTHLQTMADAQRKKTLENPLIRSGLVFAGCQNPKIDQEDGILTAQEAVNLDLDQTELVVLSACETGLGDIKIGEGVYGLQRAFQQAGAKSVIMSLWKVSDEATQVLMTEFYSQLINGKSKREAFQMAQNQLRKRFEHPYYWGAFVLIGR